MISVHLLAGLAGGIGLFLLGLWLMTEGLKLAAGPALERILARSTGTRLRGLASGVLVTAVVQSSSAVTVAAIGFVNAGLLTLNQALWVLFGTNVGTTMTGWLVALAGLDFKIEAAALPMVGLGMLLHFTGEGGRRGGLGMALAGFGVLFLGIDTLKDSFSGLGERVALPDSDGGAVSILAHVLVGILLTVLMQSSSAALAVALTAAQSGLLPLTEAAGVVVGANIGTTVKAILVALGATANARRAAAAHVLFNLLTGAVALIILPWLLGATIFVRDWLAIEAAPAATLALFHTVFNLLGVALMWPLAGRLTEFLEARFRTAEEDEARPRYLDPTVTTVPILALDALAREVRREGMIVLRAARRAVKARPEASLAVARDLRIAGRLREAIAEFVTRLHRRGMAQESARRLPGLLRVSRYYAGVAEMVAELGRTADEVALPPYEGLANALTDFLHEADVFLAEQYPEHAAPEPVDRNAALAALEDHYQALKARLLEAGADGHLTVAAMDAWLRRISLIHRAAQQAAKAMRTLEQLAA